MKYFFLTILALIQVGCAINHQVMVGDERVIVQQTPGKGNTYVHVHQNEQTALKAAKTIVRQQGGSLITLLHSGGRNISFHLNRQRYEFDPNRIYTNAGIKKTLAQYSHYTPEAYREVKKLAQKIKQLLPEGKVIAVHNNATYSLKDYLPGHNLAADAKAVHLSSEHYFRNFYLVTKTNDFVRLKTEGFNGVLQKKSAVDDGSLSIYLAKREYINVEAGYNQLGEQINMLRHA